MNSEHNENVPNLVDPENPNPSTPDTVEAEPTSSDPWENSPFGSSLTGDGSSTVIDVPATFAPVPVLQEKSVPEEVTDEKPMWLIREEQKEQITSAEFDVRIDTEAISSIIRDHPELLPPDKRINGIRGPIDIEERRVEIQRTLDALAALPERLHFEVGITLIVGENGIGKSTLARALNASAGLRDWEQDHPDKSEESLESMRSFFTGESNSGGNAYDVLPSPLVNLISPLVTVDNLLNFGHLRYHDLTIIMGSDARRGFATDRDSDEASNLLKPRSHRQSVDTFFEWKKLEKDREIEARNEGKRVSEGPQVYFIDEPETGLSPRRHLKLEELIHDCTFEGSIVILPTNSTVLYGSDLPRIDLEHPERGIFRPSDYPEDIN